MKFCVSHSDCISWQFIFKYSAKSHKLPLVWFIKTSNIVKKWPLAIDLFLLLHLISFKKKKEQMHFDKVYWSQIIIWISIARYLHKWCGDYCHTAGLASCYTCLCQLTRCPVFLTRMHRGELENTEVSLHMPPTRTLVVPILTYLDSNISRATHSQAESWNCDTTGAPKVPW